MKLKNKVFTEVDFVTGLEQLKRCKSKKIEMKTRMSVIRLIKELTGAMQEYEEVRQNTLESLGELVTEEIDGKNTSRYEFGNNLPEWNKQFKELINAEFEIDYNPVPYHDDFGLDLGQQAAMMDLFTEPKKKRK